MNANNPCELILGKCSSSTLLTPKEMLNRSNFSNFTKHALYILFRLKIILVQLIINVDYRRQ